MASIVTRSQSNRLALSMWWNMDVQPTNLQQMCDAIISNNMDQISKVYLLQANKVAGECNKYDFT